MTTLERIRAEIEEQKQVYENESNVDYGVRSGLSIALKIIDKYAEEEEPYYKHCPSRGIECSYCDNWQKCNEEGAE